MLVAWIWIRGTQALPSSHGLGIMSFPGLVCAQIAKAGVTQNSHQR